MIDARLAPVDLNSIKLNVPTPFSLVDCNGVLLAQKEFVFQTQKTLDDLANHGNGFFVNFSDRSDPQLRATEKVYVKQLLQMLRSQGPLGELSKVHINYGTGPITEGADQKSVDWFDLIEICDAMLRTRDANFFTRRLHSITVILSHQLAVNPDEALVALFYLSEKRTQHYSATHCMLVCVICVLTASSVLHWSDAEIDLLMRCALTMNIGMADLQDRLTDQAGPTDMSQKFLIREHANLSVQVLQAFDIVDKDWLDIVGAHHAYIQAPIQSGKVSDRLVGLLNRADIFAAKLSSRASRKALHSTMAMKSTYYDSDLKADDMGAAIIKAVGIYRPGSFVKLASGEVGVVVRRGTKMTTPAVVVVLNRDGVPVFTEAIRDTSDAKYAVLSSVPLSSVKVTLNLEKILGLSKH